MICENIWYYFYNIDHKIVKDIIKKKIKDKNVLRIVDAIINGIVKLTEPIGELGAKDNTKPFQLIADSISNLFLVQYQTKLLLNQFFYIHTY